MPALTFAEVVTPTLLRRFLLEAHVEDAGEEPNGENGPAPYYACVKRDDGNLAVWHPYGPPLDDLQLLFSQDALKRLNKDLHHDGAWVIVFTNPAPQQLPSAIHNPHSTEYRRYALIWLDADADPQFTIEWHEGITSDFRVFADVMIAGINALAERCEAAWEIWAEQRRMLELKNGHTYRRAKGERASSL